MTTEQAPATSLTTVGELGPNLPIGFVDNRTLKKGFELRPYQGWVERNLALWRLTNEGMHLAMFVPKVLSMLLKSAGPHTFELTADKDSTSDQEAGIYQWHYGDVMYMWLYARIKAVGAEMQLPYACTRCGKASFAIADLNTVEVQTINTAAGLRRWVELGDGVQLCTGRTAKKLQVKPITFHSQYPPGEAASVETVSGYKELAEAVCGADCEEGHYTLRQDDYDSLTKLDLLRIDRQANIVAAGPMMRTQLTCKADTCGAPVLEAFNWTFDNFFDSSVPSGHLLN